MGFFIVALLGMPLFVMLFAGPALILTFKGHVNSRRRAGWSLAAWLLLAAVAALTWSRPVPLLVSAGPGWGIYLVWLLIGRQRPEPNRPAWRYFAPVVVTVGLLAWMTFGAAESWKQQSAEVVADWPLASNGSQRIALSVPSQFLRPSYGFEAAKLPPFRDGAPDRDVMYLSFQALWPDMTGFLPGKNTSEFEVRGGGRSLLYMLESAARERIDGVDRDALTVRRDFNLAQLQNMCVPTGQPMPNNVSCTKLSPQIDAQEFGLRKLGRDYAAYPILPDMSGSVTDLYQALDAGGNLATFITCNVADVPKPVPAPHCTQVFDDDELNAIVEVHYRKEYLPQWREIQSSSLKLIATFVRRHHAA